MIFLVNIRESQKLDMKLVVLIIMSNQSAQRMRDVEQFVYACVACKSSQVEHWETVEMMRPLDVSEWK